MFKPGERGWVRFLFPSSGVGSRVVAGAISLALSAGIAGSALAASPPARPAGPDITVVGFAVADGSPGPTGAYQLQLNFQAEAATVSRSIGDVQAAMRHAALAFERIGVPRTGITPGAENINVNKQNPVAQVDDMLTIDLTAGQIDRAASLAAKPPFPCLQSFYLNTGFGNGQTPLVSAQALGRAYAQALEGARVQATAIARADGLTLGPVATLEEGQPSNGCNAMGGPCADVSYTGPVGPNQVLETLTVVFTTHTGGPAKV